MYQKDPTLKNGSGLFGGAAGNTLVYLPHMLEASFCGRSSLSAPLASLSGVRFRRFYQKSPTPQGSQAFLVVDRPELSHPIIAEVQSWRRYLGTKFAQYRNNLNTVR
jgi:hypothetical protein